MIYQPYNLDSKLGLYNKLSQEKKIEQQKENKRTTKAIVRAGIRWDKGETIMYTCCGEL